MGADSLALRLSEAEITVNAVNISTLKIECGVSMDEVIMDIDVT